MRKSFWKKKALLAAVCILAAAFSCCGFAKTPLEVHFIDVGQGDAILAKCGNAAMLIDGGNSECSDLIYSYLKKEKIDHLDYIICTHEDEDHIGGLPGAVTLLQDNIGTVFSPVLDPAASKRFTVLTDVLEKFGKTPEVPAIGKKYKLGSACFQVLSYGTSGGNEGSIVIKLWDDKTSYLFAADIPEATEKQLMNGVFDLKADVLKVAHHGGADSSGVEFLNRVKPKYAVISVGKNNDYGHPAPETMERLQQAGIRIVRTDVAGSLVFSYGSRGITINEISQIPNSVQPGVVQDYVLNTHSMKFHYPNCPSVEKIRPENRMDVTDTRKDLLEEGFLPCGNCNP